MWFVMQKIIPIIYKQKTRYSNKSVMGIVVTLCVRVSDKSPVT